MDLVAPLSCGILVSQTEIQLESPALQGELLTTGLPGKPQIFLFGTHFTDEKLSSENTSVIQPKVEDLLLFGGGLPYLSDTASRNLRVSSFWRHQVERKDQYFNSTYKGVIFQIVVSHKLA